MSALAVNCRCFSCQKTIAATKAQRVEIEVPGKPAQSFDLCPPCARRMAQNLVRIERAQGLQGVLRA